MFQRNVFPGPPGLKQIQDSLVEDAASKVTERNKDLLTNTMILIFSSQMETLTTEATALVPGRMEVRGPLQGISSQPRLCTEARVLLCHRLPEVVLGAARAHEASELKQTEQGSPGRRACVQAGDQKAGGRLVTEEWRPA